MPHSLGSGAVVWFESDCEPHRPPAAVGTFHLDSMSLDVKISAMDSSGIHLWLVFMKAYRSLARYARCSIEPQGLGHSDFAILELLLHKGRQPINAIGRHVDLTSGAITSAVDRLEAQRLVVRTAHAKDRRSRFVSLTPKGTARIREVFGVHKRAMEDVTSSLTMAEREALVSLIKKLGRAAEDRLSKGSDS